MNKLKLWDADADRIQATTRNLAEAMRSTGIALEVEVMAEAPLIARTGLSGRLPALEIDGDYWIWRVGEVIPVAAIEALLRRLRPSA